MGNLTGYLQQEFIRLCPAGWTCKHEQRLLSPELAVIFGYAPRADVVLERRDGAKRIWIEFEVSRADPVANHAKFATAHLFQPQPAEDAFIAMVSPHVTRGRRNVASNTIELMRYIGMDAFQAMLFPHLAPAEIKRLNHLGQAALSQEKLDIDAEVQRALGVAEAITVIAGERIHFVGDPLDVLLNLRRWNHDLDTEEGRQLWGKRTITYFAFDPHSRSFAPSKFCAYLAVHPPSTINAAARLVRTRSEMNVPLYVTLESSGSIFDGARARTHLMRNLGMQPMAQFEAPDVAAAFKIWLGRHSKAITVHPSGPVFLLPPAWFR